MRIEINSELAQKLDAIKSARYIYCKGHSDTVAYLVRYYEQHGTVEKLLEQELAKIPEAIHKAFLKAMRTTVTNLLSDKSETG